MHVVNAISKARFSSAKPQRIQLGRSPSAAIDMLCLEAGQQLALPKGDWTVYVVTGTAALSDGSQRMDVPTGHLAAPPADRLTLDNPGEGRLICLAFTVTSCR